MKRAEIRTMIKAYLSDNNIKSLSQQLADNLKIFLQGKYPNEKDGNSYTIECEFTDLFVKSDSVTGRIDRCDPLEPDFIIDSVSFSIDADLRIMTWEKDKIALNLDMDNLSEDDKTDIMNIDSFHNIDVYGTFMRTAPKNRGKLAAMIPNSMALELFEKDIPPYAFYQYDGLFYHTTNKGVGNLGGGFGFGGFVRKKGSIAEIGNRFSSIGEHAFDGCLNLTEIHISGNIHYVGKHAFSNIPGLVIYCSAPSKPSTWEDDWCDEFCKVYFKS